MENNIFNMTCVSEIPLIEKNNNEKVLIQGIKILFIGF